MIHTPYRDYVADEIELAMHRRQRLQAPVKDKPVADDLPDPVCDDEPVYDIDQVRAECARTAACVRRSAELWEFFWEGKDETINIKSDESCVADAA